MSSYPDHEPGEVFVEYGEDEDGCSYEIWMDYDEIAEKAKDYMHRLTELHVQLRWMDRMTNYSPTRHKRPYKKPTGLRGLFYDRMVESLGHSLKMDGWFTKARPMDNLSYKPAVTCRADEVIISGQLLNDL